jgi:hypothetical protein
MANNANSKIRIENCQRFMGHNLSTKNYSSSCSLSIGSESGE